MDDEYRRFDMTEPPKPSGTGGEYEEALTQWLLEHTFFRDYVPLPHIDHPRLAA